MSNTNPYESPTQNIENESVLEYADINLFSSAGRLGRLRYFTYSFGIILTIYIVIGLGFGISSFLPEGANTIVMGIVGVIGMIAMIYMSILLMVKRLHDTNKSGWLSLVMLIPIISIFFSFYLWFMPGSGEKNSYGNPPPPNKTAILIIALLAILVILGIMGAIGSSAYNDYLLRAQQAATAG